MQHSHTLQHQHNTFTVAALSLTVMNTHVTLQLQLHGHALVLQPVNDLTAVPPGVVEPQLFDHQRHVAGSRAAQAHAAPEAAVATVAVAQCDHHLGFPGGGSRRGGPTDGGG